MCIFRTSTGCNANQTCGYSPLIEGGPLRAMTVICSIKKMFVPGAVFILSTLLRFVSLKRYLQTLT